MPENALDYPVLSSMQSRIVESFLKAHIRKFTIWYLDYSISFYSEFGNRLWFKRSFNLFLGWLHIYILINSLINIISKVHLQKSSILQHVTSLIQSIFDKGILDHSIVHTVLMEYFNIADKVM